MNKFPQGKGMVRAFDGNDLRYTTSRKMSGNPTPRHTRSLARSAQKAESRKQKAERRTQKAETTRQTTHACMQNAVPPRHVYSIRYPILLQGRLTWWYTYTHTHTHTSRRKSKISRYQSPPTSGDQIPTRARSTRLCIALHYLKEEFLSGLDWIGLDWMWGRGDLRNGWIEMKWCVCVCVPYAGIM